MDKLKWWLQTAIGIALLVGDMWAGYKEFSAPPLMLSHLIFLGALLILALVLILRDDFIDDLRKLGPVILPFYKKPE